MTKAPQDQINSAYVFAMSPEGAPVLAGQINTGRAVGYFRYDESWLNYPYRYPLDPVNLPLQPGAKPCRHNGGVFPAFSDAAPDAWGTRIMLLRHQSQPRNEVERLLRTSGRGVGSLQFSLSRTRPKAVETSHDIGLLGRLYEVAEAIDTEQAPDSEALRLIQPGSSMGGARPKAALHDGDTHYLAKFSKESDLVDVPRVEYATMRMLATTTLDVPAVRLEPVGKGRSAYLIERFDLKGQHTTHHYVSAHALFNIERVRQLPDGHLDPAGYVALTRHLRGHCDNFFSDGRQLFLRALTNIIIGNTDDHARNFGMCYALRNCVWSLAPVFDVLPAVSAAGSEQAMALGVQGRASNWENLLSCCIPFGLDEAQAYRLAHDHLSVLTRWEAYYQDADISARDLGLLRTIIEPRMESIAKSVDWK